MKKQPFVSILLVLLLVVAGWLFYRSTQTDTPSEKSDDIVMEETNTPEPRTVEGGLQIQDLKEGDGPIAVKNALATVHYTGWLAIIRDDGTVEQGAQFDSSRGRDPFSFLIGAGAVIQGWDIGVEGMRVGGIRRLVIPPDLGYGAYGAGGVIPPNATLLFEVELLSVGT